MTHWGGACNGHSRGVSTLETAAAYNNTQRQVANISNELVMAHTPLVKRIAHHLIGRLPTSVMADDMIQAGMLGLLDAAQRYNTEQGASFETYATLRIRGAMIDELRRNDWAPKSVHRKARNLSAAVQVVENRTGRDARDEEIIAEMGISSAEYHKILRDSCNSRIFNFDDLGSDSDPLNMIAGDSTSPLDELEDERFRQKLTDAIASLPDRERMVLSMYYEKELNLREIGKTLGVSESRISQILSRAYARLRTKLSDA